MRGVCQRQNDLLATVVVFITVEACEGAIVVIGLGHGATALGALQLLIEPGQETLLVVDV